MAGTLRLTYPQWQGGLNPDYALGSTLLEHIAPPSAAAEQAVIPVDMDFTRLPQQMDGIDFGEILWKQAQQTAQVLREKQPDKVIVFGGDCSVTQVPFDYLSGKYGEQIGLLWLDAHPDCAAVGQSSHLHEMVMGNLIGLSPNAKLTAVEHPYSPKKVLLAGLIEQALRPMDMACKEQNIRILSPEILQQDSSAVAEWLQAEGIRYLAVHWDLDVLSPVDFRSIYPAEPYTDPKNFHAAVGSLKLDDIARLLNDVSRTAEIVGLSITEHLPWDALRLRNTLRQISIFG